MIEIAKLKEMLKCEAAASKWWDGLAPKEKKAYIAAHPKSKFAKGGKAPTTAKLDRLAEHHWSKANSYNDRAVGLPFNVIDPKKKAHYSKAGNLHATIARHYSNAAAAMSNNRPGAADIHLNRAEKTQHQLDQHLATKPAKTAEPKVKTAVTPAKKQDNGNSAADNKLIYHSKKAEYHDKEAKKAAKFDDGDAARMHIAAGNAHRAAGQAHEFGRPGAGGLSKKADRLSSQLD